MMKSIVVVVGVVIRLGLNSVILENKEQDFTLGRVEKHITRKICQCIRNNICKGL